VPASEKLNIDTPEQVALEFSLASVGSRFLALGIDTLIQAASGALLLLLAALGAWTLRGVVPGAGPWILGGLVLGGFVVYYG